MGSALSLVSTVNERRWMYPCRSVAIGQSPACLPVMTYVGKADALAKLRRFAEADALLQAAVVFAEQEDALGYQAELVLQQAEIDAARGQTAVGEMRRTVESVATALGKAKPNRVLAVSEYGAHVERWIGMPSVFRLFEARLSQLKIRTILLRSAEHMEGWGSVVPVALATPGRRHSWLVDLRLLYPRATMTSRQPPSWDDVERVVRLLGDVAGLTLPVVVRRRRLMKALVELVDADIWAWVHLRVPVRGMPVAFRTMDGGWVNPSERSRAVAAANEPDGNDIPMAWARQACLTKRPVTAAISRLPLLDTVPEDVSQEAIARHGSFSRAIGIGDQIFSHYPLSKETTSLIGLHRRVGGAPFTDRDVQLVHLVVSQIDWLHREGAAVPANADPLLMLTPRERHLLLLETGGASRKQIAGMAALSSHTVSDHFKSIYRKLGVRSQSELMALFISGPA